MEIRQLEYFVAVAETGSFTHAAEACNVVQTTVSHAIAALERELDIRLFARDGRAVSLTEQGRSFLPDARAIVERTKLAERSLCRLRDCGRQTLKLGYYGAGLADDFPEVLRRFRRETGCNVELRGADAQSPCNELAPEVRHGALDAFIIAHAPIGEYSSWAEQRVIAYNSVYLSMAEDDELAIASAIRRDSLSEVAPSVCLYRASRSGQYGSAMSSWLAAGFGIDSSLISWNDSMEDVRLLTRCGQCRTVSFYNSDLDCFRQGGLVFRKIEGMPRLPITLIWKRDNPNPAIEQFAKLARIVASEHGIDVEQAERLAETRAR